MKKNQKVKKELKVIVTNPLTKEQEKKLTNNVINTLKIVLSN